MSKRQLLSLLGLWIMLFLFLGIPSTWHKAIAIITGLLIIVIAYNLPHSTHAQNTQDKESEARPKEQETFVESK